MNIALLGYGRMGKSIEGFALENGHHIVLKIKTHNTHELTATAIQQADVAIDFSLPQTAWDNIQLCIDNGVPVVSGTTGWTTRLAAMNDYCLAQGGTFLYASNFSVGMNIFFEINQQLARSMATQPQYEVSMHEIHHIHKLDAPSGTAITLAEQIMLVLPHKTDWQHDKKAAAHEIPISSARIDMTPGTHSIHYSSPIDDIEIKHTAHSRDGFAKGALLAAEWLVGKQGIFSMKNVLFGK